jgi:hypothetical protein
LVDLNDDGNKDVLSGSYSRMSQPMAGLFQVLWGTADGKGFRQAQTLNGTDGDPLVITAPENGPEEQAVILESICTRPVAVDWNADGHLDLVVGNFAGSFYLFVGEGGGKFRPQPQPLMSGGARLTIQGQHSDPFVIDWDRDGDLDLLSGSSAGGVHWA